jgi:hypothetical protein
MQGLSTHDITKTVLTMFLGYTAVLKKMYLVYKHWIETSLYFGF